MPTVASNETAAIETTKNRWIKRAGQMWGLIIDMPLCGKEEMLNSARRISQ
jgi:hypothetical protein